MSETTGSVKVPAKLSSGQQFTLRTMRERKAGGKEWDTAFGLCSQAKTLFVLERLGYVERRDSARGRTFYDNTDWEWRIKP